MLSVVLTHVLTHVLTVLADELTVLTDVLSVLGRRSCSEIDSDVNSIKILCIQKNKFSSQ